MGCDLGGRWLMTERTLLSSLGIKSKIYNWYYVELQQNAGKLMFSRSLSCGASVVGTPPFVINSSDEQAWPSYLVHPSYEGRTGNSTMSATGCNVTFDRAVTIRGATFATYRDPSVPLPTLEQHATDTTPGWEDWDGDGKPGVTYRISGTATGAVYVATRVSTRADGAIAADAASFWLALTWDTERSTLGTEGSPLYATSGSPDPDPSEHYVELARLTPEQASGDASAICARVRELAPTLTPKASN